MLRQETEMFYGEEEEKEEQINTNNKDLEGYFLHDLSNHGRPILSIGAPNSGKTYVAMKYVVYALNNQIYD